MAAIDSSPEKSPEPCLFLGLVRVGKPRIPVATLYISKVYLQAQKKAKYQNIALFLTNDITSSEVNVLLLKARRLVVQVLGLSKNL